MELLKYSKNLSYSYVFGAFGTIELLKNQPLQCKCVLIDPSFTNNEAFKIIKQICNKYNIKLIIDLKAISKIKDKGNIYVIGVFNKYCTNLTNNSHIVLYNNDNAGDVGTIIRSLRGFAFENLVLINCNIDLYDNHLIRATMGAFFSTNIKQYNCLDDYIKDYPNYIFVNITNKGNDISLIKKSGNLSLIFSNESIEHEKMTYIKMDKDISLENIVNITLFNLYS